jgi:hypothetical protein
MTQARKALKKVTRAGRTLRSGTGWRLLRGDKLFNATLVTTINKGGQRLAVFSVPKRKREDEE